MELGATFLLDFFKTWPTAVVVIAALLILLGWWAKGTIATQDDIAAVNQRSNEISKHAEDMETLNAAQHRQLTEGFNQIIVGFREDLKLNDLAMKEKIGGVYDRINPMDQRLSKLEGEHNALTGSGYCPVVREPGNHG